MADDGPGAAKATSDPGLTPQFSRGTALLVAGTFFMEILDGTIIAPAAPQIAATLGVAPVDVNVAITAYLLTLGVVIPASGWVADRFGARRVFMLAIAIFTLASVGCAMAHSLPMLVAARVLQGLGGSLMVPVGRYVVLRTTSKRDLVHAIAFLTWPALIAPVIAPALGGLIATYGAWQWIFLVNVPLGALALILARRLIPAVEPAAVARLDWVGFLFTAGAVAALIIGLEQIAFEPVDWPVVAAALAVAAVAAFAAIARLVRAAHPLLDLRVLRITTYRTAAVGGTLYRLVISAVPFLLALGFQLGFGWNAATAGLVVVALFAGNVLIKPTTTPLMRRFGVRSVLLSAIAGGALCLLAMAALRPTTPLWVIVAVLALSGVFRSIGFTAYNTLAFSDVDSVQLRSANTLHATLQEVGSGLGIAIAAVLVRLGEGWGVFGSGDAAGAFRFAYLMLAGLLVLPAIEALLLPSSAAREVTSRATKLRRRAGG